MIVRTTDEQSSSNQMKWSELEATRAGCKEHPNSNQLPGVCSSCLRDKLSQLYNNKSTRPLPSSPSSTLSASPPQPFSSASAASSNYVSPAYRRCHRRHASNVTDSVSSMVSFNYGLKKSRSIAFAARSRLRERDVSGGLGRKKDGFWSKLLKLTRKDTKEAFVHARTIGEGRG